MIKELFITLVLLFLLSLNPADAQKKKEAAKEPVKNEKETDKKDKGLTSTFAGL